LQEAVEEQKQGELAIGEAAVQKKLDDKKKEFERKRKAHYRIDPTVLKKQALKDNTAFNKNL
jgi:hypothetical protein